MRAHETEWKFALTLQLVEFDFICPAFRQLRSWVIADHLRLSSLDHFRLGDSGADTPRPAGCDLVDNCAAGVQTHANEKKR